MQTVQTSAFPDECPDEVVKESPKRMRTSELKLRSFLTKEGPYSFCKMSEEIRSKTADYCIRKYGATPEEVWKMCESIFAEYVLWRETIDSFLKKCRTVPSYNIHKLVDAAVVDRERKKKAIKSGWIKKQGRKKKQNGEDMSG